MSPEQLLERIRAAGADVRRRGPSLVVHRASLLSPTVLTAVRKMKPALWPIVPFENPTSEVVARVEAMRRQVPASGPIRGVLMAREVAREVTWEPDGRLCVSCGAGLADADRPMGPFGQALCCPSCVDAAWIVVMGRAGRRA